MHATRKTRQADLSVAMPLNFASQIGRSDRASQLIWHGLAQSTRKGAHKVCTKFSTFVLAQFNKRQCFPSKEEWLVEYVAEQDQHKRSYHAIQRDVYSLRIWHVDLGLKVDGFGMQLERALRGVKQLRGVPAAKAALPIQLPLLKSMLTQLPLVATGLALAMYRAAMALAFACFLRCGELTHSGFNPKKHLSVGSVYFAPDRSYAIITLPSSKTDIGRQGVKVVAPATDGIECPVLALLAITIGRSKESPLFHTKGTDSFDREAFINTVRQCISLCQVPADGFSGHSFRRGAATWASRVGYTEEEIKVLGHWNSDCVRRYIDRSADQRCSLALKMFRSKPKVKTVDISDSWRQF